MIHKGCFDLLMVIAEALRDHVSLQRMCQVNYSGLVLKFPFSVINNDYLDLEWPPLDYTIMSKRCQEFDHA